MRQTVRFTVLLFTLTLLVACAPPEAGPMLPTATPFPTPLTPSPTATQTPLPTVTPYPTATLPPTATLSAEAQATLDAAAATAGVQPAASLQPGATTGTTQPTVSSGPTQTPAPSSTPAPTLPPPPSPTPAIGIPVPSGVSIGEPFYVTDFSAGWPTINDATAKIEIVRGQYVFELGPFDGRLLTTTLVNQADYYVALDAYPDAERCPARAGYGIVFRYVDNSNYYVFTVYCDNTFAVAARIGGRLIGVGVAEQTLPSGLDAKSAGPHELAVIARGTEYWVFMDGVQLANLRDNGNPAGDVAPYAVSNSEQRIRVAFDNLEVRPVR